ncbi:MAG: 2-amino-4-hydroxy-6-hydroxymethyldihydropteridine diphosphokinase [Rhodobacteraceae bacterium]|nr:2-amino-4-hydroxy-6-hydroxymethyldihydropteridine diphosphokinase [Paracoccaceae bacterium]
MGSVAEYNTALVAIGSNLPAKKDSPIGVVRGAIAALRQFGAGAFVASRLYRTPAFPYGSGPDFVNAAVCLSTRTGAAELLEALHAIEAEAGRVRERRWGARVLDLDLLGLGDAVLPDAATYHAWAGLAADAQQTRAPDRLILPHPRLHERAFVLVPLMDVAPDWVHPVLSRPVRALHDALSPEARAEVVPITQECTWSA